MAFENRIFIANERKKRKKSVTEIEIIWTIDMQNEPIISIALSPTIAHSSLKQ